MSTSKGGTGGSGGGHSSGAASPMQHVLDQIAQASAVTADAVTRLLAVQRFGPSAGAGFGAGGYGGYPGYGGVGSYGGAPPVTPAPGGPFAGMSGPKSASTFAQRQQALGERTDILGRVGFGGVAASANRTGQFAGGLQALGATGPAAFAQRAAIPLAVAGLVANTAETVAGYAYDRYSTSDQIGRQVVRDLVPGGARVQRFVDAMSGREAGMEQARIDRDKRLVDVQGRIQQSQFLMSNNPRQAAAESLASAYSRQSAVTPGVFDRSTALGERAYHEEQRILPLKQAEAKAERDAARATGERVASQKELNTLSARKFYLDAQQKQLERKLGGEDYQSGPKRLDLLNDISAVAKERNEVLGLLQGAKQNVVSSSQRESEAKGEFQKAQLRRELQGRAEVLESRADTASGSARRLGMMNAYDRALGLASARFVKGRNSTDSLPDLILHAASGFAPAEIGKIAEQTGLKTAEFQAATKEFPVSFAGNPNDLNKEAAEARKKLAEGEFGIDSATSQRLAAVGRDLGDFIISAMKQVTAEMKRQIERDTLIGRSSK